MLVLDGARMDGCVISKSINTTIFYYLVAWHRREGGFDGKDPDLSVSAHSNLKYGIIQHSRSKKSDFLPCLQNYVIRN